MSIDLLALIREEDNKSKQFVTERYTIRYLSIFLFEVVMI